MAPFVTISDAILSGINASVRKIPFRVLSPLLEKLRSGEALTDKERQDHEMGLVSVLKQLHDELDLAVFAAYGWPKTLSDEEILEHLVALNRERATEEEQGLIRWLRPEYQKPVSKSAAVQTGELTR